jgi:hypothetical protein
LQATGSILRIAGRKNAERHSTNKNIEKDANNTRINLLATLDDTSYAGIAL